jgi:hydroxyacylglutathione hydrolase
MLVETFLDEGLGNTSYLIASEAARLAAVLDPQRDIDRYLQRADGLGLKLVYALDTHLHNDFVSGSRELAAQAGVQIGASAEGELHYEHLPMEHGDVLTLGDLCITALATPGHTPEHIAYSVSEGRQQDPTALFTGGALIPGGAARTDLLGEELAVPLARRLFHSIHEILLRFPDEVLVHPTHGAGSFCAAPISTDRITTIGRERLWNPLILAREETEFVNRALDGLSSFPTYFKYLRRINQHGPKLLGGLPTLQPLDPDAIARPRDRSLAVLDVRTPREFSSGHIPGSYGIPLGAPLITWAGWVIPFGTPLVLVGGHAAMLEEAVRQLVRIGYDDLRGYLEGGFAAWEGAGLPVSRVPRIGIDELARQLERSDPPPVIDVRLASEWRAGHIPGALNIEAGSLPSADLGFAQDQQAVVHCAVSNRSTVGASLLERRGYRNVYLLEGGFDGWEAQGLPVDKHQ